MVLISITVKLEKGAGGNFIFLLGLFFSLAMNELAVIATCHTYSSINKRLYCFVISQCRYGLLWLRAMPVLVVFKTG